MIIHYDKITGKIVGYESNHSAARQDGCNAIISDYAPDMRIHKVDIKTKKIILIPDDELLIAENERLTLQLQTIIASELANSDKYVMPDRDDLIGVQLAWIAYRSALRKLKHVDGLEAKISAFPTRPDGTNAANMLRPNSAKDQAK